MIQAPPITNTTLTFNLFSTAVACSLAAASYFDLMTKPTVQLAAVSAGLHTLAGNTTNSTLSRALTLGSLVAMTNIHSPFMASIVGIVGVPIMQILHANEAFNNYGFMFGALEGVCATVGTLAVASLLITTTPVTVCVAGLSASIIIQCSLQCFKNSLTSNALER